MAAARYWRLVGIETYAGGDLELSELQWFDNSGRVDASATVTCSHGPVAGSLAALNDENPSTVCRFAAGDLHAAGFWIRWDLGSARDVTRLRVAAPVVAAGLLRCVLQQSDDGLNWLNAVQIADIAPTPGGGLSDYIIWRRFAASLNRDDLGVNMSLSGDVITGLYNGISARGYEASGPSCQFEVSAISHSYVMIGVGTSAASLYESPGKNSASWGIWLVDGSISNGGSHIPTGGAINPTSVVGVVVEFANLKIYVNGILRNSLYTGLPADVKPMISLHGTNGTWSARVNLGATPFIHPIVGASAWAGDEAGLVAPRVATCEIKRAIAASAPLDAHAVPAPSSALLARDVEFGGSGTVYGTTKTKGTPNLPTKARVVLLHQRSKLPVRETWSDPVTGAFAFTGIDTNQQFLTLAEDAAGNFLPVAANRLTPEVLT